MKTRSDLPEEAYNWLLRHLFDQPAEVYPEFCAAFPEVSITLRSFTARHYRARMRRGIEAPWAHDHSVRVYRRGRPVPVLPPPKPKPVSELARKALEAREREELEKTRNWNRLMFRLVQKRERLARERAARLRAFS
jgi:hypothetical protein